MADHGETPRDRLEHATGYRLWKLGQLVHRRHDAAAPAGETAAEPAVRLSSRHVRVLALLQDGACSQTELSRSSGLDRTTMVGVVDALENRGFVARTADPRDRRNRRVTLTTAGEGALPQALAALQRAEDEFFACLSAREMESLTTVLNRLYDAHRPECDPTGEQSTRSA